MAYGGFIKGGGKQTPKSGKPFGKQAPPTGKSMSKGCK